MRLSRRTLIRWGIGLPWLGCFAPALAASPAPADSFKIFMGLAREVTGFEFLDPGLGRRYLEALRIADARLDGVLVAWSRTPSLVGLSPSQLATVDLIVEAWYNGTVPTWRGTEVVTFQGALGWKCLSRPTPVTWCR